jgi:hypothetical protein
MVRHGGAGRQRGGVPPLALVLAAVAPWAAAEDLPPVPRVQAVPLPHHVTSFRLDDRELVALHHDPRDMRPFWHPLRGSHEPSLTRMGHPHDPAGHSHHNSLWISHNALNGLDFWGDRAPRQGRIVTVEVPREAYTEGDDAASMRMVNHWLAAEDGAVVAIERRRTEVRPLAGAGDWLLVIDLEFAPPPGRTLTFGATGFGPVGVRMARSIGVHDGGGRILNSAGERNEPEAFRRPARWCDYAGRITNDPAGFGGVALLNHPGNPHHPTAFHVRDDGWMGCCLSLEEPVTVAEGGTLRLRYGVWVHDGIPDAAAVERRFAAFTALPPAAGMAAGPPR